MARIVGRPGAVVLLCVVALVASGAVAWGAGWWRGDTRPSLAAAMSAAPADAVTWNYTDWQAIGGVVGRRGSPAAFASAADRRDLATRSVLATSAGEMARTLGWSVRDLRWESYSATRNGELAAVRLDDVSPAAVRAGLREAGYRREGRTWTIARTEVAAAGLSDLLTRVVVLDRRRVVVMGSTDALLARGVRTIRGTAPSLAGRRVAVDAAEALSGSQTIALQVAAGACGATAVTDAQSLRQAEAAQDRAGRLRPYVIGARGIEDPGGRGFAQTARFALTFSDPARAREQLPVREALSRGAYIGRSGEIADTLRFRAAEVSGATLTLSYAHDPATEVFMIGTGPALFASCGTG